tara:strand:+ start:714 stop:941 length:228 start_codon:yes stop_codon:yes gene_type:complete
MADNKPVKTLKVRAIKRGFFGGQYRLIGDEFECPEGALSKTWMEVKSSKNKPIKKPKDGYVPLEIPDLMNKSDKE